MRGKKLLRLFLTVVTLLGMVAVVHAGTRGVRKNEIVVGTHTALSGPAAGWGIDATNGMRLRFEEANAAGGIHGRKIRYITEDSQYQVPIAIQKANKLVNRDKVFFLIGSIGTPMNNAVFKAILEKKNVPNLFPYSAGRSMYAPLHKLKFSAVTPYYDNVRAGLKHFVEEKGKKRICMMAQDTDFGHEITEGVKDQLKAMNMDLVAETSHKASETSFVGAITKLRKANCDVVMLGTIIRDTIIAVSTARKMGWGVDMLGQTASVNYVIPAMGKKGVEGLYGVSGLSMMYEDQATGRAKEVFMKYKEKFGKTATEVALNGYIVADLAVIAMERAGRKLTVNSLIKGLESIKNYQDPFGGPVQSYGPRDHLGPEESVLYQIKGGRWLYPTGQKQILSY